MTSAHEPTSQDVIAHLYRLAFASSATEIIKELQLIVQRPGPQPFELSLRSLTPLAEAHLRERRRPACDALTGLLGARAFAGLLRAHARHASATHSSAESVVVVLTLLDAGEIGRDPHVAELLRTIARLCEEQVAADDYLGRIAPTSIAVLPRSGGVSGAHSVCARLIAACVAVFASSAFALRLRVDLRDATGAVRDGVEVVLGKRAQVA